MQLGKYPSGIYYARYYTPSGQRKRVSLGTKSKRDAQQAANKLAADLWAQRHLGEAAPVSLADALAEYNEEKGRTASAKDNEWRRDHILAALPAGIMVGQVGSKEVEQLKVELGRTRKPASVNRYLAYLRAALGRAKRREYITQVPEIESLTVPQEDPKYLTFDEVVALEAELRRRETTEHAADWLVLALETGLRLRNGTHLRWDEVDMQSQVVRISAHRMKARTSIEVPLNRAAMDVIRDQIGKHPTYVLTYQGRPFDKIDARTLTEAAGRAGVAKRVHPHMIRHTFAVLHVQRGTPLSVLMQLGGWSSLASVQVYARMDTAEARKWADQSRFGPRSLPTSSGPAMPESLTS